MDCNCPRHYHHHRQSASRPESRASSHHSSKAFKSASSTLYPYFCRECDTCPTCGAPPQEAAPRAAGPVNGVADAAHVLPRLPPQMLFTLFLLESHIGGGWRHLIVPYAICLVMFSL
ncbi:hypothetical protein C8F01DRAFT_1362283 [Mycena amicta]|nr:hypothetical protein C8F01DRAFT_1362283 [Mycena amicta]